MDFGDYDVLGDILSDGSDDSFFDEPKRTTKSSAPARQRQTEIKKESNQDDLTGLPTSTKTSMHQDSKGKIDWLGLDKKDNIETERRDSLTRTKKTTKKISFEDDDILGTLGFNEKSDKTKRTDSSLAQETKDKKTDLLESILKSNTREKSNENAPKVGITAAKSIGEGYAASATANNTELLSFPREGRRKRVTSGLVDPLGLFSEQTNEEPHSHVSATDGKQARTRSFSSGDTKDIDTVSSTKSQFGDTRSVPNLLEPQGTPDWLGLSSKPKTSENDWTASSYTKSKSDITMSDRTETVGNIGKTAEKTVESDQTNFETSGFQTPLSNALLTHEKFAKSQIEFQSAAVSLQQQESQILIALQMKKYEDSLMEIQRQQQEILMKQDNQFSALLERQFAKQQAMENGLKMQQERINNHIQLLLTQPRTDGSVSQLKEGTDKTREIAEEEYLKANENLINNLKQRHHEELFILEESYKKQISVLEDSSQQVESRLKSELEAVISRNEVNLNTLKENYEKEMQAMKKKFEDVEKQHVEEFKLIRDNHLRVMDEMKYEQNILIENLKESKRLESSVIKESGDFGRMLDANIHLLQNNSQILQNVSGQVETQYSVINSAREEAFKAKEKEIEMMRTTLEKCRESAETERTHLLGLVRSLETKIAELNQTTREERWAMQQAVSTLASRSAAFDREMEFSRASIEREREQVKTLKESLLAEQEKMMIQLTEEKLSISAEKARLTTTSKLNVQFDTQKAKAELEAAIQVAKDAAEMTDRERDTLQRRILEFESLKRVIKDKERKLVSKEEELSELIYVSEQKYKNGERALKDAKMTEAKCNEKMRILQDQLLQLSSREKKVSEEQIALSKERLELNTLIRRKQNCKLCSAEGLRNEEQRNDWTNYNNSDINIPPRYEVTEAEIFRLQFEDKEEEPRSTNKYA
ncbi:inner centromere protein A [Harmonia axyridis]|uniref:inner centromere protein A n=1 Tax=Harmonia axyridis TaxID=115357 RepID=UPI001E277B9D|nr:inner centromere protein A [Harmonia axyridis]